MSITTIQKKGFVKGRGSDRIYSKRRGVLYQKMLILWPYHAKYQNMLVGLNWMSNCQITADPPITAPPTYLIGPSDKSSANNPSPLPLYKDRKALNSKSLTIAHYWRLLLSIKKRVRKITTVQNSQVFDVNRWFIWFVWMIE